MIEQLFDTGDMATRTIQGTITGTRVEVEVANSHPVYIIATADTIYEVHKLAGSSCPPGIEIGDPVSVTMHQAPTGWWVLEKLRRS